MARCTRRGPVTGQYVGLIKVWVLLPVVLSVPSCLSRHRGDLANTAEQRPEDALRRRANDLWYARQREDWNTVFLFEDPHGRDQIDRAEFAEWCREHEPFRTHSFEIGQVITDGLLGWVEVECQNSIRQFPDVPPRNVHRWEKWRRVQDLWYPVPRTQVGSYPESPAVRDADAEARLRARFDMSFEARQARDWDRLYELSDPHDHTAVPMEEFVDAMETLEFLSHKVLWVQVVGDQGVVYVVSEHKKTDPSLTKMEPERTALAEKWVRRDGEWYLDLDYP